MWGDWLGGGGGQRVCRHPPLKLLGEGRQVLPLPTPMNYKVFPVSFPSKKGSTHTGINVLLVYLNLFAILIPLDPHT